MSTLTDRYIWGVLRAVPTAQRADLEPEVRAMVLDAIEARAADGLAADAAERAALAELGDPELLAARYTDASLYLLGPRYYPDWKRLLSLLLTIVVPITAIAVMAAGFLAGKAAGELILDGMGTAFMVGIQLAFWMTLVFVLLERSGEAPLGEAWTPDRLPELPVAKRGTSVIEVGLSVVALGVGAAALVWQQVAQPVTIDGAGYPLFNPALWSFWLPWFLLVFAAEIVFTLLRWRAGGWTWPFAVVNLLLNLAFAVPAVYLVQNGLLLDPGLVAAIDATTGGGWLQPTLSIVTLGIVVVAGWDAFDGFRQAWLARPATRATA